jgi:hypothetical protein
MHRVGPGCRTADRRSWERSPLAWFAIIVAVMALLSLAIAAAVSVGVNRLLPNNEPFIPYYTT